MTDKPIRVGIIGLNPGIHWAATANIPALKALPVPSIHPSAKIEP